MNSNLDLPSELQLLQFGKLKFLQRKEQKLIFYYEDGVTSGMCPVRQRYPATTTTAFVEERVFNQSMHHTSRAAIQWTVTNTAVH